MIVGFQCKCGDIYPPPKRKTGWCNACRAAVTTADNKVVTSRQTELDALKEQLALELEAFKQQQTITLIAFEQRTKLLRKNAVAIALRKRGHYDA